ncbi:hypothetical protein BGY98DRAFT_967186 [Russula aff. rugulosa BPL654]|nr:hypothetical protein BGY98DRAFT_967186 [Russula aff. rugulosa BPL654]
MNPFIALAIFIPAVSALTVNTPMSPVACQPLQITWSPEGSSAPYYLSLIPAGQPSASALKQFPPQQGTSYTWEKVSLPVGTGFTVAMKDGNGQQVYSAPATVQDGGDSSCVNRDVKEGKEASTSGSATNSTSGAPDVATTNSGTSSGHAAAATGPTSSNSAPVSHKSDAAKSTGSASPSQSVKANSVARDISSGAIAGIMFAVGVTSVLVTLVV